MPPAPDQFRWQASLEIQLISAFFKAIQAYSNLFKEKNPPQPESVGKAGDVASRVEPISREDAKR
jgi:hypothetical protein